MKILITGGAGFVGSSLAFAYKRESQSHTVVVVDNLKRRGSEINLPLFRRYGIEFVHGDIRNPNDLEDLVGEFDLLIEGSAEPSVHAGVGGSPNYVLQTNLTGTLNCLEFARRRVENFLFLSTSRVYSIAPLRQINLRESATRFEPADTLTSSGLTSSGVTEDFPTNLPRSFYGATKLASELIIQEYVDSYGLRAIINRCGVLAGPGQFGKVDQGVFTLWVANHYFERPLKYTGFGGKGKQVRDLLHPLDLFALLQKQLAQIDKYSGQIFNVGGGYDVSTSLLEFTALCWQSLGKKTEIEEVATSAAVDIPWYISDHSKASAAFDWSPERSVEVIIEDIIQWLKENEEPLKQIFV